MSATRQRPKPRIAEPARATAAPAPSRSLKSKAAGGGDSIAARIGERLALGAKASPGRVFTPFDFIDLGTPHSVGMALMRLVRAGGLRHLARGLYDVPRSHPLLGVLQPSADEIAQALARRDGASVQPSEAMAANLLGLSEQVPARPVYETDGPSRTVKAGSVVVQLKKRPARKVRSAAPMSSLVFAGLRSVGKDNIDERRVAHLRTTLSTADRARLLQDLPLAPAWMHRHLRFIADGVTAKAVKQRTKRHAKAARVKARTAPRLP